MSEWELRRGLADAARRTVDLGLNHGTCGNVSARVPQGLLITPSGTSYASLEPQDILLLSPAGAPLGESARPPSTEWRLHAAIFAARPELHVVIHAHAPAASALACLRRDIPAFHYMVAAAGGSTIRCAGYATTGTSELAARAVTALAGRLACLLANHGLVACGACVDEALELAVEVEWLAEQYLRLLPLGSPPILDDEEMARVVARFGAYRRA